MHPALRGLVRSVRVGEQLHPGMRVQRLPEGTTSMLLRVYDDGGGELSLAGPRSRAVFKTVPPAARSVLVDFEPGASALFMGVPPRTLLDRYAPIESTWGDAGRRLRDRLVATTSLADARRVLEDGLVQRLRERPPNAAMRLARRAVARLRGDDAPPRVSDLAGELGVSARHLRRVFDEVVGLSPKELARMARLQRALAVPRADASWSERAIEAGYYDQAHFIADFRDLVGTTPSRFAGGEVWT